ncbi:uncharacterized protein KD926_005323 [Aspergillus affinis]|uniref:uncharacterized protein n=1 Tax=Aspergillus affinis TaxID=1070780 RepID=UPI0022FEAF8F|nr:uncharacterized protein KD926_005323 [Aspergillus affinis]KAI9034841.1 hypothetical protein KD926_005323 [Aspergillus affinis]
MKPSHELWKTVLEPQNYTIKLWTDDDVLKLIKSKYAWLLQTYMGYPHNIQRADIARLLVVHAEGGIYADLDVYPRSAEHIQCLQHLGLQAVFSTTSVGALRGKAAGVWTAITMDSSAIPAGLLDYGADNVDIGV